MFVIYDTHYEAYFSDAVQDNLFYNPDIHNAAKYHTYQAAIKDITHYAMLNAVVKEVK